MSVKQKKIKLTIRIGFYGEGSSINLLVPPSMVAKWLESGADWVDLEYYLSPRTLARLELHRCAYAGRDCGYRLRRWEVSEAGAVFAAECYRSARAARNSMNSVHNPQVFVRAHRDGYVGPSLYQAWPLGHPVPEGWVRAEEERIDE